MKAYKLMMYISIIPILSPAVYCGFGRCGSQRFPLLVALLFDVCIKSIQIVVSAR